MSKNNEHNSIEKITTSLRKETSFNGVLRFKESLKIDGTFEGEIESPGFLFIENGATVKANIKVGSVVVGGVVVPGRLAGIDLDLRSGEVLVATGGLGSGTSTLGPSSKWSEPAGTVHSPRPPGKYSEPVMAVSTSAAARVSSSRRGLKSMGLR